MADRFDLDAIEADDALLDLLAAGGESAWQAGEHDPALKLLAGLRLAVEVEDQLPVETIDDPESFLARCAALYPVTDPFARKMAARGLALGVAAVAALSVSGVAAAVTGDPLAPYEKVIQKVVDGLRDETSFPKEQLDGMPVVDKTKIVRVGKDYRDLREAETKAKNNPVGSADDTEASVVGTPQPPLALPVTQTDQQLLIEVPVAPSVVSAKPAEPEPPTQPVDPQPTADPTAPADPRPTEDPTALVDPKPTEEPSTPTTPPTTEPTTEPPSPPSTPPTDNGSTGSQGNHPSGGPSAPVTEPTTLSSTGGQTSTGSENNPSGDQTTPGDQGGDQGGDAKGDEASGDQPGSQTNQDVVPVLPTSTGAPVEEAVRLQEYFGQEFSVGGKHAGGKPALGWAKSQYAKGKHSSGHYAEGRHAAITRAHGSMAPVTIRQILGVLNTPMTDR